MVQPSAQGTRAVIGQELREVPLEFVTVDSPVQTRAPFDPEHDPDDHALVESYRANLAAQPSAHPQKDPVVLAKVAGSQPAQFVIVSGHRRIAGLRFIKCPTCVAIIQQEASVEADILTLTENVRKNLAPIEQARALQRLREQHDLKKLKLTFEQVMARVGLAREYGYQLLDLLKLPAPLLQAVERGTIGAFTARALSDAGNAHAEALAEMASRCRWSREEAKKQVARMQAKQEDPRTAAAALGLDREAQSPDQDSVDIDGTNVRSTAAGVRARGARRRDRTHSLAPETVAAMISELFPDLDNRTARALSEVAVKRSADAATVKLAGLLVEAEGSPTESLDLAAEIAESPAGRRVAGMLDEWAALGELTLVGKFPVEALPLFTSLAKKVGGLRRVRKAG
jgi:ParB/RepB/Spo0J family partition protein